MVTIHGCSSGPRNFENDNDKLRRQVIDLTEQNAALSDRVAGLEARLQAEQTRRNAKLPDGFVEPKMSRLRIHKYSGGVDTDGDGSDDAVRIYLQTLDDRGRFVQTIATADITVSAAPPGKPAVTLATKSFTPKEIDAAYRAGLTGTHYTLVVPLDTAPAGIDKLNIAAKVTDLSTGQSQSIDYLARVRAE